MGEDIEDPYCPYCLQTQIDAGIPATSRTLTRLADCDTHQKAGELHHRNIRWVLLYQELSEFHLVQAVGETAKIMLNIQALEILCTHYKIDFIQALQKMRVIHRELTA